MMDTCTKTKYTIYFIALDFEFFFPPQVFFFKKLLQYLMVKINLCTEHNITLCTQTVDIKIPLPTFSILHQVLKKCSLSRLEPSLNRVVKFNRDYSQFLHFKKIIIPY